MEKRPEGKSVRAHRRCAGSQAEPSFLPTAEPAVHLQAVPADYYLHP